jgi:hypothetical protein
MQMTGINQTRVKEISPRDLANESQPLLHGYDLSSMWTKPFLHKFALLRESPGW